MPKFADDIKKFNQIYRLPISEVRTLQIGVAPTERLSAFKDILAEELDECNDIAQAIEANAEELEILTGLADWLGDIQVYCASEATKFGIGVPEVSGKPSGARLPTLDIGMPVLHQLMGFKMAVANKLSVLDALIESIHAGAAAQGITDELGEFLLSVRQECAAQMKLFGIPNDDVLEIIMQSNFSKLDANGQPIYDERGKVMKGPHYWKPEPKIKALLQGLMDSAKAA
jgi:hypothetical protein